MATIFITGVSADCGGSDDLGVYLGGDRPQHDCRAKSPGDLSIPDTSMSYPNQGQTHIEIGASHPAYNSNPPTSGWHYIDPAPWGVYPNQLPDETLIHNLEHGGIWLSYKDPTNQRHHQPIKRHCEPLSTHIIVEPRPQNDSPVAVAAWGQLLKMDTVNYDVIYAFIRRYRKHGPENVD